MDGIELACRFSYITNSLGFCGPKVASEQFLQYVASKKNKEEVCDSLRKFEGLYPYLSAIGKKHNKDWLDTEVVEAYWLGNSLLDSFTQSDMKEIIHNLAQRGLPESISKKLQDNLPQKGIPHHDFNVLFVGVGKTTGSVETTLQNMDNCRISWGKVAEVLDSRLIVVTPCLKHDGKNYFLGEPEPKTVVFIDTWLPNARKGDYVALHWGFAALKLSEKQLTNLQTYTKKVMNAVKQ